MNEKLDMTPTLTLEPTLETAVPAAPVTVRVRAMTADAARRARSRPPPGLFENMVEIFRFIPSPSASVTSRILCSKYTPECALPSILKGVCLACSDRSRAGPDGGPGRVHCW